MSNIELIKAPDSAHVHALHPSPNIEPRKPGYRPDLLLLHYTGMQCVEKAIDWLARPESKVSCHYVVAEDGTITQMVSEQMRAWHAGQSFWKGSTDINSCSIGIEIHNPGHDQGYPNFPDIQMDAVTRLAADIVARHAIATERVLAHSDVAPHRKTDPGEKFDWHGLAQAGVGRWITPEPTRADDWSLGQGARSEKVAEAQHLLRAYGYGIDVTGTLDEPTTFVVRAFQLHWRPACIDSRLDGSTLATIRRLAGTPTPKTTGHSDAFTA
ncbi:MAG TPA: N-acetylmuramoyl-L-alanine amidase [Hyphomicrobiaceae bacterium]|nr:N-acetylmuramoyl-L-alanine amidase [Hyphomicrobiaceae bacterium]